MNFKLKKFKFSNKLFSSVKILYPNTHLRFFFEIDKIVCFLLFLHGLKIMHVSLEKEKKHV